MFCLFYIIPIISSLYSKNSNTSAKLLIKFGLCKKFAESLQRKDKLSKFVMARKKSEGVQLGRPKGKISAQETYKLHRKERLIQDLRAEGVSFAKIGNILKVNRDTVRRYYHTFLEEKK